MWDLDYFQHTPSRQTLLGLDAWKTNGGCLSEPALMPY